MTEQGESRSLTLRVFNVEHGDSILVEYREAKHVFRVLVDCSTTSDAPGSVPPALAYLRKQGVAQLEVLVITHLHRDHYAGVGLLLDDIDVLKLVLPPFFSRSEPQFKKVVKKLRASIEEAISRSSDPVVGYRIDSLAALLAYAVKHRDKVVEATGPEATLRIPGCESLLPTVLLPLPKLRGLLHAAIASDDFDPVLFPQMNDASIALLFEFSGQSILLGGDSTLPQWREHRRQMGRDGVESLNANCFKVPHHGSRHNNAVDVYRYVLPSPTAGSYVVVSADGCSHPHDEFFSLVRDLDLRPRCTNLAKNCASLSVATIENLSSVPPAAVPFVAAYRDDAPVIVCQGDITIVAEKGGLAVTSSTANPCVYSVETELASPSV